MKTMLSILAAAALLTSSAAFAETAKTDAGAAAKTKTVQSASQTVKSNKVATVQSEKSKKCSADADAKNLHGKARKAFRKACMKAA